MDANLKRFDLLKQQYTSDLNRLQSTVEAGNLFADHQEGPCPICGANPEHHQQHGIIQEQLDTFTNVCRAEAKKIMASQNDPAGTMAQLEQEQAALQTALGTIRQERNQNAQAFKNILGPSIANVDGDLATLSERRADIAATLSLHEQHRRLDELE